MLRRRATTFFRQENRAEYDLHRHIMLLIAILAETAGIAPRLIQPVAPQPRARAQSRSRLRQRLFAPEERAQNPRTSACPLFVPSWRAKLLPKASTIESGRGTARGAAARFRLIGIWIRGSWQPGAVMLAVHGPQIRIPALGPCRRRFPARLPRCVWPESRRRIRNPASCRISAPWARRHSAPRVLHPELVPTAPRAGTSVRCTTPRHALLASRSEVTASPVPTA